MAQQGKFSKLSALEVLFHITRKQNTGNKADKEVQAELQEENAPRKTEETSELKSSQLDYFTTSSSKTFQLQLLNYKKEAENRYRSQLEAEMQRFREVELAEVRAGEAELFQQKLKKHKQDMEMQYESKVKKLKERESKALEMCKKMQKDAERQIFESRQIHIDKINSLTQAEIDFRKHNCLDSAAIKEEREKISKLEAELKMKIREYEEARKTIQTHIEHDVETRALINKKELESENQSTMKNMILAKKDQEVQKQYKENLQFLENQRQYLARNCENLQRDNKEMEYVKSEQAREISELRQRVQTLQEANDMYDQRIQRLESQLRDKHYTQQQFEDQSKQLQTDLELRKNEQIQMHKTFADDIQKQYLQQIDTEKYFQKQLEEAKENARFEMSQLAEKNRMNEQLVQRLEDDNNELRTMIRQLKLKYEAIEGNPSLLQEQAREDRIRKQLTQIDKDKSLVENKSFSDRINNIQQNLKDYEQQYLSQVQASLK